MKNHSLDPLQEFFIIRGYERNYGLNYPLTMSSLVPDYELPNIQLNSEAE